MALAGTAAAARAGSRRGPSARLYLTEPARGLAGLAALPLAAPWLASAPRGDGHGVLVAAGAAGLRHEHRAAAAVPAAGSATTCAAGDLGRNVGPTDAVLDELPRELADARGAHRRAGVGHRLEPGRHLRQGTGPRSTRSWSAR